MKKYIIAALVLLTASLSACAPAADNAGTDGKLKVVATLFPQYDIARQVAGERADVTMLLPPGMESHTFEPSPAEIARLYGSDICIYTGEDMEPWAHKIFSGVKNENLLIVDASRGVELEPEIDDHSAGGEHGNGHEHGFDPHFWLDPTKAMRIVDNVADALIAKDPGYAGFYRSNAEKYKAELQRFDEDVFAELDAAKRRTLVFCGRFAYQYFLHHYGIDYVTAYDSCSSQAEPSVARIAEVTNYIRQNNIPCVYYEELSDPRIAKTVARWTGAEYLQFSTGHNVTKEEFESGITYMDICRRNLENIKKGLD